ncbi:FG-GAP-like repeat-containing protein [Hymenobacter artigasi]|uniref:T9SS type A sorting domain-containing protein n=1 Tax=Hymenobacter artigasi TaxID=2719616 RepID=A0ABX1HRC8_9BACT|nr:FG-GAP-like repeat-containing protein [Hymenobacter artigasi]NKI91853.1 hypothetical protein [Hymenobacter artigasi]
MKRPLHFWVPAARLVAAVGLLGAVLPARAQNFGAMIPYSVGSNVAPLGVVLADFNGDGRLDLLTANDPSQSLSLLYGQNNGTLGQLQVLPAAGAGAVALKVGDFNRDGRPDVVVAGAGSGGVLIGTAAGMLIPPGYQFSLRMTSNPGALALGDVNGDGQPDVVAVAGASTGNSHDEQAAVLLGRVNGSFAPALTYPLAAGSQPEAVALGDVNGDGRPDLAVASLGTDAVQVLLNLGNGLFGSPTSYGMGVGTGPLGVAVADVNGDGQPDLLTANHAGSVGVRLNSGGQFGPVTTYPVGAAPVGMAVGDVNNDGLADVVTAGFGSDQLSVLLGTGAGLFGPVTNYATGPGSSPISVAIGDVNGDGAPDLVSANFNAGTAGVFLSQAPVLNLTGPVSGGAGTSITLTGNRLAGATAVTFSSNTQVVTTVPATSFTSTNYTATPNTIGLVVPAGLVAGPYLLAVVTSHGTSPATGFGVSAPLATVPGLLAEQVEVFPSPAHARATVRVPPGSGIGTVRLRLCDALGRLVSTVEAMVPATGLHQELDLRHLVPGLYVLQVQAGATTVTRRLLVD